MEQYGHIEEVYDQKKKKRSPLSWIIYILFILITVSVCGMIVFRIFTNEHYPDEMEEVYFNDTLTAHYRENGGNINIYTQDIRVPCEDGDTGNFFSHALFLIPDARQVQITVRYGKASLSRLQEKYGKELLPNADAFQFFLTSSDGTRYPLTMQKKEKWLMYSYRKLIFDGVDIKLPGDCTIETAEDGTQTGSLYMTVDICLEGLDEPIARLPIYETHVIGDDRDGKNKLFEYKVGRYKLSKGERPHD